MRAKASSIGWLLLNQNVCFL